MPLTTTDQLRSSLRKKEIAPVYVLYGPETHLRDAAAKHIADLCFGEGDLRDFNYSEFSLNTDENLQRALAAAEQLPMMASRRVVRVADVRVAATAARDTIKEEHEAMLAAYLARPSTSSVIIFVADELNGNRKIGKLMRANAVAVEFGVLDDHGVREWAAKAFQKLGAAIDADALQRLIGLVGNDLRRLDNEVAKLATAALPEARVTRELVDELVPSTREISNFVLTDALNAKDGRKAMESLEKVLDDGTDPLALIGALSYNYRRLAMVKNMMDRGLDRNEVARVLNIQHRQQEPYFAAARRTTAAELTTALRLISETDLAIKTSIGGSGPQGSRMQMEKLVTELSA